MNFSEAMKQLTKNLTLESSIDQFNKTYPISKRHVPECSIDTVLTYLYTQPVNEDTQMFAHGYCAPFAEGARDLISEFYPTDIIALHEDGHAFHYVVKVTLTSDDIRYVDAYGAFDSLEPICNRYGKTALNVNTSVVDLSGHENDVSNTFRDVTAEVLDMCDVNEELLVERDIHYTELYEDYFKTQAAKMISAALAHGAKQLRSAVQV